MERITETHAAVAILTTVTVNVDEETNISVKDTKSVMARM